MISEINIKVFHGREEGKVDIDFAIEGDCFQIARAILEVTKLNPEFKAAMNKAELLSYTIPFLESVKEIENSIQELHARITSDELGAHLAELIKEK